MESVMKNNILFKRIASGVSIIGVGTASVAPEMLRIPVTARPWVFLFSIAWVLLLASGVFSS